MSHTWYIGFAAGVLVSVVLILILKKFLGKKCSYDERQVAARGQAFKAGFITFVVCGLTVFFIELFMEKPIDFFPPGLLSILICFIALLVFLEVAIFKDAYFSPDRPFSLRWCIIMLVLAAVYIVQFFRAEEKWYALFNLAAGIFIAVIMLSILIKKAVSTRRDEEDA